jgi:hypothetical protein
VILTYCSYHEATISCAVMGDAQMAALSAKKAAEIGLHCLGDGQQYREYDHLILKQLQAAAKREGPFYYGQIEWTSSWLSTEWGSGNRS